MALQDIVDDVMERMMGAVEALQRDFRTVRTGVASPALVESLRVTAYGAESAMREIAGITVQEGRTLAIRPWDPSNIKEIEKALQVADLGAQPSNDGKIVRLTLPMLSEERRKKLASQVRDLAEKQRVAVRNIRRDANKAADALSRDGDASEDDAARAKDEVQSMTDENVKEIDRLLEEKTKEIMTV